jgi:hypothetical protein
MTNHIDAAMDRMKLSPSDPAFDLADGHTCVNQVAACNHTVLVLRQVPDDAFDTGDGPCRPVRAPLSDHIAVKGARTVS